MWHKFVEDFQLNKTCSWLDIIFGLTDLDLSVYFRLKGSENARIRGNPYIIVANQCRLSPSVRKQTY